LAKILKIKGGFKMKKQISVLIVILLAFSIFAGCKPQVAQPVTLVFAKGGDAIGLDPGDTPDNESSAIWGNIFESLTKFKAGSTEVEPCLATSWDISTDALVYTFHLRQGVKFQDGTPFNADAVVFTYERYLDPNNPYHSYGTWENWEWCVSQVSKVEKVDDYTVNITLSTPFAPFLGALATAGGIVSPANCEKWKDQWIAHPVGTGPFTFVEWVKGDHITLAKNNDYWGAKPKIDTLIFRVIQDPSQRLLALQKGEVQGMEFPNATDLDKISQDSTLQLLEQPGLTISYLSLNVGTDTPGFQKPFGDLRVRQAIAYAINKQAIVDQIFQGTAVALKTDIPPTLWGYNDSIQDYEYNPTKAKELLREAGYPNGFKTQLWTIPIARPYLPDPQKVAVAIQADLKAIGIDAEIVTYDWSTYFHKVDNGEQPMNIAGWICDYPDPDDFLYVLFDSDHATVGTASNFSFYRNPEVHKLNMQAQRIVDQTQRAELYKQVQTIIHNDVPNVPLASVKQIVVLSKNVKGFVLYPIGRYYFDTVTIETSK
jgi:peptide/nickel transport system substrate-binding protein